MYHQAQLSWTSTGGKSRVSHLYYYGKVTIEMRVPSDMYSSGFSVIGKDKPKLTITLPNCMSPANKEPSTATMEDLTSAVSYGRL